MAVELKSHMTISRSLLPIPLVTVALMSVGCGRTNDVSNDPTYGNFSAVVGTWKTKIPLIFFEASSNGELHLWTENAPSSDRVLENVPIGTEIRIEHLVYKTDIERDYLYATGSFTSGPYSGKSFIIDDGLFAQHANEVEATPATPWTKGWAVAPDKLGK